MLDNQLIRRSIPPERRAFKQKYPDAVLVPLKIPAPAGQVDVWLPRVRAPGRVLQPGRLGVPLGNLRPLPQ
jgi:hypothetical protein